MNTLRRIFKKKTNSFTCKLWQCELQSSNKCKKAQLNGKISSKRDEGCNPGQGQYKSQSSSRLTVNINAGPLPLPVGVLTILDLYSKAIQPLPKKEQVSITK